METPSGKDSIMPIFFNSKTQKRFRFTEECGSVLMEYVILCCFIGAGIAMFVHLDFYNVSDGYVGMGLKFVQWRQTLLHALAIPIP